MENEEKKDFNFWKKLKKFPIKIDIIYKLTIFSYIFFIYRKKRIGKIRILPYKSFIRICKIFCRIYKIIIRFYKSIYKVINNFNKDMKIIPLYKYYRRKCQGIIFKSLLKLFITL